MMPLPKPYRLINQKELAQLQQHFSSVLNQWNHNYASYSLMSDLTLCSSLSTFAAEEWQEETACRAGLNTINEDSSTVSMKQIIHEIGFRKEFILLVCAEQSIALVDPVYLLLLKEALWGDTSSCFDEIADSLFTLLASQLFQTRGTKSTRNHTDYNDWIYPGSPCLELTLSLKQYTCRLYLHPHWILNQLDIHPTIKLPLDPLENTFTEQNVSMIVQLEPFHLKANQLINLKKGDLIQTDHKLSNPVLLQHQMKTICKGNIGQTQDHKSIQLTR